MRIDIYSMMRNEIGLLPYYLRHYGSFADRIFVWDDESDDGTREMLQAHPKVTLLPLSIHGTDDFYASANLWTKYKEMSRGQADWVMCVDADEFVYHPQLVDKLQEFKNEGFEVVRTLGFMMIADAFPTNGGQIYDQIKIGLRDRLMDKSVVFNPDIDILFTAGRHHVEHANRQDGTLAKRRLQSGIKYLHYRYFGYEYYMGRVERNVAAHVRSGSTWSTLISSYNENQRWRMPDLTKRTYREWFDENLSQAKQVIE